MEWPGDRARRGSSVGFLGIMRTIAKAQIRRAKFNRDCWMSLSACERPGRDYKRGQNSHQWAATELLAFGLRICFSEFSVGAEHLLAMSPKACTNVRPHVPEVDHRAAYIDCGVA